MAATVFHPDHPIFAHVFRIDDVVHAQISTRQRIPRNGTARVICGVRIDQDAQRIAPHSDPGRSAPITCDSCMRSFTGVADLADRAARRVA